MERSKVRRRAFFVCPLTEKPPPPMPVWAVGLPDPEARCWVCGELLEVVYVEERSRGWSGRKTG